MLLIPHSLQSIDSRPMITDLIRQVVRYDQDIQASWRQLVEALRAIDQHTLAARDEVWLLPSHGEPPSAACVNILEFL